jgi:phage FluMu gp28-like protein
VKIAAKWINSRLWPWQRRWIADRSRFKIVRKPRQVGLTEGACFAAVLHCLEHSGHTFYLVSTTVGNARTELLDVIRNRAIPVLAEDPELAPHLRLVTDNANEIELANGSRFVAVANEPKRLRGKKRCSYLFDEAAFWERRKTDQIEDAVFPQMRAAINPHGVVWVISTPWFRDDNWYADVWTNESGRYSHWSRHDIDFLKAAPVIGLDAERIKRETRADAWLTEYLRQFRQGGGNYYDRERLLSLTQPWAGEAPCFIGIDLGKVNDFTALVVLRRLPKDQWHVEHTYYMRSVDYREQAKEITRLLDRYQPIRTVVDITAHKSFVGLLEEVGADRHEIRGKAFTNSFKVEYAEAIMDAVTAEACAFDWSQSNYIEGRWEPGHSKQLLSDLASVEQQATPSGDKVTYAVPRTKRNGKETEGHGDGWSALLCALEAASTPKQTVKVVRRVKRKVTNF